MTNSGRSHLSLPSLILVIGLSLSFITAYLFHLRQVDAARFEFAELAHDRFMAIRRGIDSSMLIGKSIVGLYSASQTVTEDEFSRFTRVILQQTRYISAVEWVPRLVDPQRSEHYPIRYIEPHAGNERALGYDFISDPARKQALDFAKRHNLPSTTGKLKLMLDDDAQWGVLMCFPVYRNKAPIETIAQREANFEGVIVVVLDVPSLIEASLSILRPAGVLYAVHDTTSGDRQQVLSYRTSLDQPSPAESDLPVSWPADASAVLTETLDVNNRRWSVQFAAVPAYAPDRISVASWAIFLAGVVYTLLLFSHLRLAQRREHELRASKQRLESLVSARTRDLQEINRELEAYSYSIAHDLRSPLRAIAGYSQILLEDAAEKLDEEDKQHLHRVVSAADHMGHLIDDILKLSRVTRVEMTKQNVDLSAIAHKLAAQFDEVGGNGQAVEWRIQDGVMVKGDRSMLTLLLDNLLANAHKFSSQRQHPVIEFGAATQGGDRYCFVRDNGVGFDMQYADKLFGIFQRLHRKSEYPGTGVGLATACRIVERHGGCIWAESKVNEGATFYFSLPLD